MADVESQLARKKRSFDEKEINLLISQWSEYPCLFDKTNPDHKDQNKWDIARQQIAESLNEALDYKKGADKFITGNIVALRVIPTRDKKAEKLDM